MKKCSRCKVDKPVDDFHIAMNKGKRKVHSACKECHREYVRAHYQANKSSYVRKAKKARDQVNLEVREIKEKTPCADCGVQYPHYVMDFDHRPGAVKKGIVSRMTLTHSRSGVMAEIAKCDIVCSNCHRSRTFHRMTKPT